MVNILNVATASLPFYSLFAEFKQAYFDFEVACTRIIKWRENENEKQYGELITNVCNLSYDIWNTFAYGARIMKHDKIYKSMIPEWKYKFDEQVIILSSIAIRISFCTASFWAMSSLDQPD